MPIGTIILPVILGQPPAQIKWLTEFLVVDTPSAYNIILGRPFLVRTKSVVSIYHHVLKFPIGDRVGVIHGDQHCVTTRNDELPQEKAMETNVNEEHLEVQEEEDEKRVPKTQERETPVDDLEAVSINDEDPTKMVKIYAKLPNEEKKKNGRFSKGSFGGQANIAQSSPHIGDSSLDLDTHQRTLAFCTMGCGPHWTSPYV
ncbi:hypothetical protein ACOSP7_002773 [Xanthoceras sorbifolium]